MARVTVEDCVTEIPNRFELVMLASQRARDISAGSDLTLDRDNDKNPVVALREIAEQSFTPEELRESLISGLQRHAEVDEPDEEALELPDSTSDLLGALDGGIAGMQVVDAGGAGAAGTPVDDGATPEPGYVIGGGDA